MTLNKFKMALAQYVDQEFAAKIQGIGKWVIGMGAAAYISQLDAMFDKHLDTLVSLGYAQADGQIEIEKIYTDLRDQAAKHGKIVQSIPLIGEVTFSVEDVETLYRLCKAV